MPLVCVKQVLALLLQWKGLVFTKHPFVYKHLPSCNNLQGFVSWLNGIRGKVIGKLQENSLRLEFDWEAVSEELVAPGPVECVQAWEQLAGSHLLSSTLVSFTLML